MKKKLRLKNNRDFQTIFKNNNKIYDDTFVIYHLNNSNNHLRLGISVSKKMTIAVNRNRIRRQIRSMVQELLLLEKNCDIIILVKSKYLRQEYAVNEKKLISLLKKILLKNY